MRAEPHKSAREVVVYGWRFVAESYPCKTCGAQPDASCVTATGKPTQTPHVSRSRQAELRGWLGADEQEPLP